ncbi:MAG: hypothetical protein KGL39_01335 [Patescibacteria group bacterium]|nr:hypothetical protein [Patescibacteria group bacterium]
MAPGESFALTLGPHDLPKLVYKLALLVSPKVAAEYAAETGDVQMLEAIRHSRHFTDAFGRDDDDYDDVCSLAVEHGHIAVLRWAATIQEGRFLRSSLALARAAECGNLGVLRWLVHSGMDYWWSISENAAMNGHIHILEWLHTRRRLWCLRASAGAVDGGHAEVLKWLRASGYQFCDRATAWWHENVEGR